MNLMDLSKEILIKIIEDYKLKVDSLEKYIEQHKEAVKPIVKPIIKPITFTKPSNSWRLQVWGGCKNGKSQSANKSMIMEHFYEKGIHLIDLVKYINNNSYINQRRKQQMDRLLLGDKVYMCDNKTTYYEGILNEDYISFSGESMIKEHPGIVEAVWGKNCNASNISQYIYISKIDWVKKSLTDEMRSYLVKSTKNGGGRINMQGTILKLINI